MGLKIKTDFESEIAPLSRTYKNGDAGPEVAKIVEWLMLWQLNENYASTVLSINPNQTFDDSVEAVVKEVQSFLALPSTGIVDVATWQALVAPMRRAFDVQAYKYNTIRERVVYFATKHLQYRASELEENNMGPWIRAYMNSHEGEWAYWCAGFVTAILDQAFSSRGARFDGYYENSATVEKIRARAKTDGRLVNHAQIEAQEYTPTPGDLVIYISERDGHGHHIEIAHDILNATGGEMLTIGGNTNFAGSSNGVGVFMVDRNFRNTNVEIVKMVDNL